MKTIGKIIIFPFICIFAPFLFLAACVSEFLKNWLGRK